jgi:chromosome segregation ATPase
VIQAKNDQITQLQATIKTNEDKISQLQIQIENLAPQTVRVENLEKTLQAKDEEIIQLKATIQTNEDTIRQFQETNQANITTINGLKSQVAELTANYAIIHDKYLSIKDLADRPIVTPIQMANSFTSAIESMRKELQTEETSPVDYRITSFDIELKTGIDVNEDENVTFHLPKTDEISPDNISTIKFAIKAVPKLKKPVK